ncbi:hypothetical protein JCM11641_007957 [Rhodosporidiobolus odoratus]
MARIILVTVALPLASTGSSTGFGRCLVEAILAQGDNAVATIRKPYTNYFAPLGVKKKAVTFFRDVNPMPGGTVI